jgi:hypothetical protein
MPTNILRSNLVSGGSIVVSQEVVSGKMNVALSNNIVVSGTIFSGNVMVSAPTNGVAPPTVVQQPIGLFGSLMLLTTNYTYGAKDVYVILTNYATIRTNGFIADAAKGFLTNTVAGFYRINAYVSIIPGNADTIEGEIHINESGREEISFYGTWDNPARIRTISSSGVLYLPANSGVSLRINNRSATNTAVVWRGGLTIGTP